MTSTPPVATLSVHPTERGRQDGLLDAAIATPLDGGASNAWAVRVRGHVLAATEPVQVIEAVVPGLVVAAGRAGLPSPSELRSAVQESFGDLLHEFGYESDVATAR